MRSCMIPSAPRSTPSSPPCRTMRRRPSAAPTPAVRWKSPKESSRRWKTMPTCSPTPPHPSPIPSRPSPTCSNTVSPMATEPIPQIDLAPLHTALRADIDASIRAVIDAGSFVLGETLARFEQACADYLGVPHAIGVASGTDALLIALRAAGIGQGDEVITSAFSFFGSVEAILHAGATPVFADIEAGSMTLDAEDVARKITRRTRAIMPVHMFGQIGEIDSLLELAEAHDLVVIEDAAQAFGARFNGRLAGSFGHAGCFSFHPAKPLGALGDGGMLVTVDDALAAEAKRLRDHGSRARYDHVSVGYNSRLDALQAAVLEVKLRHLEAHLAERERLARRYRELLSGTALVLPETLPERRHVFAQFTVRSER